MVTKFYTLSPGIQKIQRNISRTGRVPLGMGGEASAALRRDVFNPSIECNIPEGFKLDVVLFWNFDRLKRCRSFVVQCAMYCCQKV